jgi:hypothetical protein
MLKRIKYVSRFSRPLSPEEVATIARQSEQNNRASDITGVLMASGRLFFQVLEGPPAAVDDLYGRIRRDARHTDLVVLGWEDPVSERLFPDWAMRAVSLEESRAARLEPLHAMLEAVVELDKTVDNLKSTLQRSLWQELVYGTERLQSREPAPPTPE